MIITRKIKIGKHDCQTPGRRCHNARFFMSRPNVAATRFLYQSLQAIPFQTNGKHLFRALPQRDSMLRDYIYCAALITRKLDYRVAVACRSTIRDTRPYYSNYSTSNGGSMQKRARLALNKSIPSWIRSTSFAARMPPHAVLPSRHNNTAHRRPSRESQQI